MTQRNEDEQKTLKEGKDQSPEKSTVTPATQPKPVPGTMGLALCALVVDDEFANRDFFVRLLQQAKLDVRGANSARKALEIIDELGDRLVLVMLDQQLPDKTGIELLKEVRKKLPKAKIMMATMHDERSMMREAFREGCTGFMVKPHGFMELFKRIQNVAKDLSVLENLDNLIFDLHGPREWRG